MATSTGRTARNGFTSGAIGAVVMIIAQAIARIGAGVPMLPDLLEDLATRLIPAPIFARVLDTLHFQAKILLFVGLLLIQVLAGALVGGLFSPLLAPRSRGIGTSQSPWFSGLGLAAALWLLTGLVILPVAGQGVFGSLDTVGPIAVNLGLILGLVLFGLTTVATLRILDDAAAVPSPAEGTTETGPATSPERRRLLSAVAVGAVSVLAAGAAYQILAVGQSPEVGAPAAKLPPVQPTDAPVASVTAEPTVAVANATPTPLSVSAVDSTPSVATTPSAAASTSGATSDAAWAIKGLASEVTSTEDFYEVSKNLLPPPTVDLKTWLLKITGLVDRAYGLGYDDLLKLPAIERYQTLQCISNEIGGDLISNALWKGVSLRDVIVAAKPQPGVVKVVFTASDGYQDSITLDRALSPNNMIAHTMNGQPLVIGHGMPARLLIPGIYGMKNVKWITKIELVSTNFQGYWQTRGWSDDAFIHTMSRIDVPSSDTGVLKVGQVHLAGIAFGGDKGISKVEVSADDGATWMPAILKEPLGQFTWRLWRLHWQAPAGEHELHVRATNGAGEVQTATVTDTLPSGATGWHAVTVSVIS